MTLSPPSPCIGICSTVYGDIICRGCKRDYREVIDWNTYSDPQKQAVLQRLQQQLESIMVEFITIENAELLQTQLAQVALRPALYTNPLCWAYELLWLRAAQLSALSPYGIQAKTAYAHLTPKQLFTFIDDKLYALAQVNDR